ncbi:very-long-chain 3-ketoacyl-CoA synthase, partial [Kipferlia bialata]
RITRASQGEEISASVEAGQPGYTMNVNEFMRFSRNGQSALAKDYPEQNAEAIKFQRKICTRTGLGQCTYVVPHLREEKETMQDARNEAELVLFNVVQAMLDKADVDPRDIDVLVVTCSLFCPTPSLTAMVVNKFGFREDVRTFNLGGMGCSGGMIGTDLIASLLRADPHLRAMLLCTENITQNWYKGPQRSMLIQNTLFRLGGACILFDTNTRDAKYTLEGTVIRTHLGADDDAYKCVYETTDFLGLRGVKLSKAITRVAGTAIEHNMGVLGRRVLPLTEKMLFVYHNIIKRKWLYRYRLARAKAKGLDPESVVRPPVHQPNFHKVLTHFLIHTGGRAVIDTLEEQLSLSEQQVAPSRAALYRYGNTSSSSVWYELAYLEQTKAMRPKQNVFMVAFGSGFKAGSAVLRSTRYTHAVYAYKYIGYIHVSDSVRVMHGARGIQPYQC